MSALPSAAPLPFALHASAVVVGECAVLLRGRSGAGKSALALALVAAALASRQFARIVADDRVVVRVAGRRLIVAPHPAIAGRVERRFVGLAITPHESAAVAKLVVDLEGASHTETPSRMPGEAERWSVIGGVRIARLALPEAHAGAIEAILHRLRDFAG